MYVLKGLCNQTIPAKQLLSHMNQCLATLFLVFDFQNTIFVRFCSAKPKGHCRYFAFRNPFDPIACILGHTNIQAIESEGRLNAKYTSNCPKDHCRYFAFRRPFVSSLALNSTKFSIFYLACSSRLDTVSLSV